MSYAAQAGKPMAVNDRNGLFACQESCFFLSGFVQL